ncbi:MAG: hypothetical protein GXX83_05340 [Gaiellales bacterium]|nr:hypothetical protein [Gaiellales bacterium]
MYQVGDVIVYGKMGVCTVESIDPDGSSGDSQELCYLLKPFYHNCSISIPVSNTTVFTRPALSREEAERLIEIIPSLQPTDCCDLTPQQWAARYEECTASHDCRDLIELTMSIYRKKRLAEQQKRKLGAVEERYMRRAEGLLFGELAVALDIPREEVQSYISSRVDQLVQQMDESEHPGG